MTQFGFDINNPGASNEARGSIEIPSAYFDGMVEDIIINETNGELLKYEDDGSNIGEALVRLLPDDWGLPKSSLKSAFPLEMNLQEFPLVGERVIVFKVFGTLFYTRKLNTKRKLTENVTTSVSQTFGPSETNSQDTRDSRQLATQGIPVNLSETINNNRIPQFKVNPNTRPLRANEGDIIFSGRFGSFIRMGSSLFINPNDELPQPNILLTAGAWDAPRQLSTGDTITPYSLAYENINNDKSSIWLISNQKVPFFASTALGDRRIKAHLLSSENKNERSYTGAQILINSDKVILNTKRNEIALFSNTEINLSALKSITLDTERSAFIRAFRDINMKADDTICLEAKQIGVISLEDLAVKATRNLSIVGQNVFIGKNGDITQPLVLGASLSSFLQTLITIISTNINAGIVVTPSGPGAVTFPTLVTALEVLSNSSLGGGIPQLAVFNSRNNFTSETNSV
jgi:hypothetical protein